MPNLVIDIGNTLTKLAIFNGDDLVWTESFAAIDAGILSNVLNRYKPTKAIRSSVKKQTENWEHTLDEHVAVLKFNAVMAASIRNHYQTPLTLGLDRVAAVAGARALYPDKANLVIDAGTCITYDWVSENGNYFGGSISPGLNMRYKALNYYTSALPLLNADENFTDNFGTTTNTSIQSGVQNGVRFEVLGFIGSYFDTWPKTNILLTGGDSIFFDTLLKNSIFAPHIKNEPHLVLSGLNAVIQQHND